MLYSYLLIGFVAVETYRQNYHHHFNMNEYIMRIIYTILTVIVAIVNPIPFASAMLCAILGVTVLNLIFPACVQICLIHSGGDDSNKNRCYLLIIVGIVLFTVGLYSIYFGVNVELKFDFENDFWLPLY